VFKNFELKGRCRLGINQGNASSGAFSFSKYAGYSLVGGDYLDSTIRFKKYVLNSKVQPSGYIYSEKPQIHIVPIHISPDIMLN
jgi:hypothetical protein